MENVHTTTEERKDRGKRAAWSCLLVGALALTRRMWRR